MKQEALAHPKTHDLADRLNLPLYAAVGILELLWSYAGKHTPRGDIGRASDSAIAREIDWRGKADKLIAALEQSHWIDANPEHRYIIHDWPDHAQEWVKKKLQRTKPLRTVDWLPVYRRSLYSVSTNNGQNQDFVSPTSDGRGLGLGSVSGSEEKKEGDLPPEFDEQFQDYRRLFTKAAGGAVIDEDFQKGSFCWRAWCLLDFAQRTLAVQGLTARIAARYQVKHRAASYLQSGEYKRPIAMPTPQEEFTTRALREA